MPAFAFGSSHMDHDSLVRRFVILNATQWSEGSGLMVRKTYNSRAIPARRASPSAPKEADRAENSSTGLNFRRANNLRRNGPAAPFPSAQPRQRH
jgi:hypothetical protein